MAALLTFISVQIHAWTSEVMQTQCSFRDTGSRENKFLQTLFFLRQVREFSLKKAVKQLDIFLLVFTALLETARWVCGEC